MVQREHQYVLLGSEFQQLGTQQRPMLQIEGLPGLSFQASLQDARLLRRHRFHGKFELQACMNNLYRLLIFEAERGTQDFMAADQDLEAALQSGDVQLAAESQGRWDVVGRTLRLQLPEKPLPLLSIGKRQPFCVLTCLRNWELSQAHAF